MPKSHWFLQISSTNPNNVICYATTILMRFSCNVKNEKRMVCKINKVNGQMVHGLHHRMLYHLPPNEWVWSITIHGMGICKIRKKHASHGSLNCYSGDITRYKLQWIFLVQDSVVPCCYIVSNCRSIDCFNINCPGIDLANLLM